MINTDILEPTNPSEPLYHIRRAGRLGRRTYHILSPRDSGTRLADMVDRVGPSSATTSSSASTATTARVRDIGFVNTAGESWQISGVFAANCMVRWRWRGCRDLDEVSGDRGLRRDEEVVIVDEEEESG